ncbi:MAG: hypothetical protein WC196_06270 [Bacilli bacterium]|jgi:hypothetical protein
MRTQNDLSFQQANLDYNAMVRTAQIATVEAQSQIEDLDKKLHEALGNNDVSLLRLIPEWMERELGRLTIASETLATLIGGLDRAHINIVNRDISEEAQAYLDSEEEEEPVSRCYNKINLIKQLREMLAERGYNGEFKYPGLKDCKDMVEALIDNLQFYK